MSERSERIDGDSVRGASCVPERREGTRESPKRSEDTHESPE
jgi:hypothetical protein